MWRRRKKIASFQTVRLGPGSHKRPEDGACVMELASMLAGERFSDRPRSVCPVIAAFLRMYNDRIDEDRRRDLYDYAADAVDTRSDRAVRQKRVRLCHRFAERCTGTGPSRPPRLLWFGQGEIVAQRAALAAIEAPQPQGHSMALALVDALIAISRREQQDSTIVSAGGEQAQSAARPWSGC